MADYRRPAPEVSWDKIDQILEARKPRLLWLKRMAAAVVLLLISGTGYWFLHHNEDTKESQTAIANTNQQALSKQQEDASVLNQGHEMENKPVSISYRPVLPILLDASPESQDTVETYTPVEEAQPHAEDVKPYIDEKRVPASVRRSQVFSPTDLSHWKEPDNRLTAKVYLSNTMNNSYRTESSIQHITNTIITKNVIPNSTDKSALVEYITVYDTAIVVQTKQTDRHIQHRQPVRFGLSLRYQIDDHWSIESGLSYTRLVSDITTVADGQSSITNQRLNYIGLPMNVGYMLWEDRHFGLYVAGGGTLEKMLDASPWQFSLNGAAGAEYRLTDVFSLYAEPGVGYYFSNGSTTPTIYQEHPFNFNLSFGLRLNLK